MSNSSIAPAKGLVKYILGLALPMAWSRFIQMIGWFIGMMMVAHLGKDFLATSALINSIQMACIILLMSLLFAISVIAGRLYGEQNYEALGILFQQGFILSLIIGILLTVIFYYVGDLLSITGQSPIFVKIATDYFHVFAFASIPLMVLTNIQQFLYGILKQRLVILVNIFSLFVLIPMAYCFIFGKFGFPALGMGGFALAIILQCLANIILLMIAIYFLPDFKKYQMLKWRNHQGLPYIGQLLRIGWPMSVQYGGELLAFFVMTIFMGWLGTTALAASQITLQITLLFLIPLFAVAEAAGILVSQAIGSRQFESVERTGQTCVLVGTIAVLILSILFFAMPNQLSALYIDIHDPHQALTVKLARWLFYLSSLSLLLDTLRNLYTGALRGFYDTQFPMWVGLIVLWLVALPLGYVMGFWWHWGVIGIRLAIIVGFMLGAAVLWCRWRAKLKVEII